MTETPVYQIRRATAAQWPCEHDMAKPVSGPPYDTLIASDLVDPNERWVGVYTGPDGVAERVIHPGDWIITHPDGKVEVLDDATYRQQWHEGTPVTPELVERMVTFFMAIGRESAAVFKEKGEIADAILSAITTTETPDD